jgi:hypothetical protein
MEEKNCFGCRFALGYKDYKGQVRCGKAEELFGGERWVNFKEVATCGTYEPAKGDETVHAEPEEPKKEVVKVFCTTCAGTGRVSIQFVDKQENMNCHICKGKGNIVQ